MQALNEDLVKIGEEYVDPREKLQESFSEHYPGQSVLSRKMAILDIKLLDTPCFRRLCIPSHCSLMQLHWVIQILFSWKDAHLHVFETEDGLSLDIDFPEYSFLVSEGDWEQSAEAEMERYLSIGEVFAKSQTIQYIYNLGDYWVHRIALAYWKEDTQNSSTSCILAIGAIPSQEAGNLGGYIDLCNVIWDPRHKKSSDVIKLLNCSGQLGLELWKINEILEKL